MISKEGQQMNLRNYYDSLMQRMESDKNKEKYAAFSLNSTDSKEFEEINRYKTFITNSLKAIPTISDKMELNLNIASCRTYLKNLERLLDKYGW